MLHTTFSRARGHGACEGYDKLRAALPLDEYGDDTPISLMLVLERNGVADAIWCLRCTIESSEKLARLFACECAERVLPLYEEQYPNDARPRRAIDVARRFAQGGASEEELAAARDAATSAAWVADRDAAGAAAWAADGNASEAATWAAAGAAVGNASGAAMWDAAWTTEREWQAQLLRKMLEGQHADQA